MQEQLAWNPKHKEVRKGSYESQKVIALLNPVLNKLDGHIPSQRKPLATCRRPVFQDTPVRSPLPRIMRSWLRLAIHGVQKLPRR